MKGPLGCLKWAVHLKAGLFRHSWGLWLDVRVLYHPFVVAVHLAFHLSDYTKLGRRRRLPVFLFTGSVACEKLTEQVTKPRVLTVISKIIPWNHRNNSFREKSQFPGATKYLQTLEFYTLIKDGPLQRNMGN